MSSGLAVHAPTATRRRTWSPVIAFLALVAVLILGVFSAPRAEASFGVTEFHAEVRDQDGLILSQAGARPFTGVTDFAFNETGTGAPDGNIKDIRVDVPAGLISNPEATPKCTDAQFPACPPSSQLGRVRLVASPAGPTVQIIVPIYNMVPPPDRVSVFSFSVPGLAPRTDVLGSVRSDGDYGVSFDIKDVGQMSSIKRSTLTFWGVPADPAHDAERGQSCQGLASAPPACGPGGQPSLAPPVPFLTNPTFCGPAQTTKLTVTSHQNPDEKLSYTDTTPTGATGCDAVPFAPSISVSPGTTKRDSPTGLNVNVNVPQSQDPQTLGTAHLRNAVVTLPPGLTLNPSAANGLEACSDEQFGKGSNSAITCPAASKVGTATITSHTLPGPINGTIYVGRQLEGNPYRIFVVVAGFGVTVKLEGKVTPDPVTGQLTAIVSDNPQLPFTDFLLRFDAGPRSVLAMPLNCGSAQTTSALAPWSGKPASTPASAFTVDADGAGAACPAATPFSLGFQSGTGSALAGAFTPFTIALARDDGNQYLSKISLRQPPGLLGVIAGVPLCGEAEAAAGTCAAASRIGTATTSAGAGSQPFTLSGPVSLTGPYKGAPFGLSIAIRALAGPYDLGTVVVRAAIRVDPTDAHLTVDSDPLPTILQGIPLRLRNVTVSIDREQFIFNPTSCAPLAVTGTLTSTEGATQAASSAFQATGCEKLAFTPKLRAVAGSRTSRSRGAGLAVTVTQPAGQANIRSVATELPLALATRGTTLARSCLAKLYEADPVTCPGTSRVGTATAVTPVLAQPMRGTVYLVARGNKLPSIEVVLEGQGITVRMSGTITIAAGRIKTTFQAVPDVPVTSFKLDLPTGPNSALSTRKNLCATPLTVHTAIVAQNGVTRSERIPLEIDGCTLRVVKRSYKVHVATLTIQTPSKGRVTITGKYLRTQLRTVRVGHTKIRVPLSKLGAAQLKRNKRSARPRSQRKLQLTATVRLAPAKPKKPAGSTNVRTRLTFR